jgi:OmpA-OmpF porin, OOP family
MVYKHALTSKTNLFARGGVKIGIPLTGSYRLESSNLKTRLYFAEWDLELFNIPAHGLYDSRTDWHPDGNLQVALFTSAVFELGIDFQTTQWLNTRVCAYASIGLNDIINESQSSLIYWRNTYNSMLTLTEKVALHQFGLRLSFAYRKPVKTKQPVKGQELPIM